MRRKCDKAQISIGANVAQMDIAHSGCGLHGMSRTWRAHETSRQKKTRKKKISILKGSNFSLLL